MVKHIFGNYRQIYFESIEVNIVNSPFKFATFATKAEISEFIKEFQYGVANYQKV